MGRRVNAIRGGSWYADLNSCTAVYEGRDPSGRYPTVGFRVAATADRDRRTARARYRPGHTGRAGMGAGRVCRRGRSRCPEPDA